MRKGFSVKIGAIIQARMSSKRLPGKVLKKADGKPMLLYLCERISRCGAIDHMVVSTSSDPSDDPIEGFCRRHRITCFRGPLHNVAERYKRTLEAYPFDTFVRVNGDSPLLDQHLIDRGLALYCQGQWDIVSNVFPRSFPPGQSVEIIRSDTFFRTLPQITAPYDVEHVTPYFYGHPELFRIHNFTADKTYPALNFTVDTPTDFIKFQAVVQQMRQPPWRYGLDQMADLLQNTETQPQGETA